MAHICQCLSRLLTFRRDFPVTIAGNNRKTGQELVEEVVSLAHGLLHLGVTPGDVVAISAYNRYLYTIIKLYIFIYGSFYRLLTIERVSY